MNKLPSNRPKLLRKASEHQTNPQIESNDEPTKGPIAFDTKFLSNLFNGKTHTRLNLKGQDLTSPSSKEKYRMRFQIDCVQHILADDNCLQMADFHIFPNVSILSLRSNKLHHLPTTSTPTPTGSGDHSHFQRLSRLDLSSNWLESNSLNYLNQLKNLVELRLNSNCIKFFTHANNLSNLSKLVRLELCNNGIESCKIFHHLSSLASLHELVLNNNHLRCIPFLLRQETAEKLGQISGKTKNPRRLDAGESTDFTDSKSSDFRYCNSRGDKSASPEGNSYSFVDCVSSEGNISRFDDEVSLASDDTRSSSSIEEICCLLTKVYQPQTADVLSSFQPRTLSTLYEGSEPGTPSQSDESSSSSEMDTPQVQNSNIEYTTGRELRRKIEYTLLMLPSKD